MGWTEHMEQKMLIQFCSEILKELNHIRSLGVDMKMEKIIEAL